MGKHIRLGKFERNQQKLAARWRASIVNDNLHISLDAVQQASEIASPMAVQHLQSKGARGGGAPFGRSERFTPKSAANPKRFSNR